MKESILTRNVLIVLCLNLAGLTACSVLGYKSPSQLRAGQQAQQEPHVVNTASNNRLSSTEYGASESPINHTNNGNTSRTSVQRDHHVDCARYMAGRPYYLQSPQSNKKVTRVRVGASGYGAPPKSYFPEGQRRLMTIRASKIDAYRALAEVVGGLHIWGSSAIGDMVIQRDRYHTFIDTYVRGARVLTVTALQDGTYKTDVEMEVDQDFLSRVMAFTDPAVDQRCLDNFVSDSNTAPVRYGATGVTPNFYYSH